MSVTIRDVARKTGLSASSVSMALRGLGRFSKKTRSKVIRTAKEMGYQPNPLLAKALSMVRQPSAERYRETLAFILEYPTETGPDYQKLMQAGAEERAASLSYKLEAFVLSGRPLDHRRWSQIFQARGIRGLIIIPRLENRQPRLHMTWDKFAAVEIGRSLWNPRNLHRVENSEYYNLMETMHLLKKVGYRRIGLAIEPSHHHHQKGLHYAGFLLAQQRIPAAQRVPILAQEGGWNEKDFQKWMRRHKPDVLFVHWAPDICRWLAGMGLKIPDDVSVFNINVRNYDEPGAHNKFQWSGLRHDYRGMGQRAVEMLSSFLLNGEIGLVGNPSCWQVDEFWEAGATLKYPISKYISPEGFLLNRASGLKSFPHNESNPVKG